MFQRILVPLDGSSRAERAILVALRLARASGGSLVLLRATNNPPGFCPFLFGQQSFASTVIGSALFEAQRYLADVRTACHVQEVEIKTSSLVGLAASTILQVAVDERADLIVLCSHGYTGLSRQLMGSVAEKVACCSAVPVLILREGGPIPTGPHPDTSRTLCILVPLDGSPHAEAALAPAAALVTGLVSPAMGALHLTRVVQLASVPYAQGGTGMEDICRGAKSYLRRTVQRFSEGWNIPYKTPLNLAMTWSVITDTHIANALLHVATTGGDTEGISSPGGCEIIAMVTHGSSGASLFPMGSVVERVLNGTNLPVLIVHPALSTPKAYASRMETASSGPQFECFARGKDRVIERQLGEKQE
jgi:nucleotide-binding universal stress UspA family protein